LVTTLVSFPTNAMGLFDGVGSDATFRGKAHLSVDLSGNVIVGNSHRIRQVTGLLSSAGAGECGSAVICGGVSKMNVFVETLIVLPRGYRYQQE
jgi:hypothetical protein